MSDRVRHPGDKATEYTEYLSMGGLYQNTGWDARLRDKGFKLLNALGVSCSMFQTENMVIYGLVCGQPFQILICNQDYI